MPIYVLILALVGQEGSSVTHIDFAGKESCENAIPQILAAMKATGAPGWSGDSGIIPKAVCVKK